MPPLTPAKRRGRPPKVPESSQAPVVPRHPDDAPTEDDDEEFVDELETEEPAPQSQPEPAAAAPRPARTTPMAKNPAAVTEEERREQAAAAREEDQAKRREMHEERKRLREEQNAAAEEQMSGMNQRPTPTQEENDLAALGVDVVDKEPDGSPETEELTRNLEAARIDAQRAAYKTR